jgi:hypothetical protein
MKNINQSDMLWQCGLLLKTTTSGSTGTISEILFFAACAAHRQSKFPMVSHGCVVFARNGLTSILPSQNCISDKANLLLT